MAGPGLTCRRSIPAPAPEPDVDEAPVPDLLGSILSGQSLLLMDSADITIHRDGSLSAKRAGEAASAGTEARSARPGAFPTQQTPGGRLLPSPLCSQQPHEQITWVETVAGPRPPRGLHAGPSLCLGSSLVVGSSVGTGQPVMAALRRQAALCPTSCHRCHWLGHVMIPQQASSCPGCPVVPRPPRVSPPQGCPTHMAVPPHTGLFPPRLPPPTHKTHTHTGLSPPATRRRNWRCT